MQGSETLRPANLRKQPFALRRLLPGPGDYEMLVTLHLVEAIEANYRTVEHRCTISAAAPSHVQDAPSDEATKRKKRRKVLVEHCERVTITTQDVTF